MATACGHSWLDLYVTDGCPNDWGCVYGSVPLSTISLAEVLLVQGGSDLLSALLRGHTPGTGLDET